MRARLHAGCGGCLAAIALLAGTGCDGEGPVVGRARFTLTEVDGPPLRFTEVAALSPSLSEIPGGLGALVSFSPDGAERSAMLLLSIAVHTRQGSEDVMTVEGDRFKAVLSESGGESFEARSGNVQVHALRPGAAAWRGEALEDVRLNADFDLEFGEGAPSITDAKLTVAVRSSDSSGNSSGAGGGTYVYADDGGGCGGSDDYNDSSSSYSDSGDSGCEGDSHDDGGGGCEGDDSDGDDAGCEGDAHAASAPAVPKRRGHPAARLFARTWPWLVVGVFIQGLRRVSRRRRS